MGTAIQYNDSCKCNKIACVAIKRRMKMLKTNQDRCPILSVQGQISHPGSRGPRIDTNGMAMYLPGTGGISYNAKIGDCAIGWVADHLEPGVSVKHSDIIIKAAFNTYSCVGNEAIVVSGDAKGAKGFVVGTHGGIEHVIVHFDDDTMEKLIHEDKILVKSWGQSMTLTDYPDITLRNMSPQLLQKLNIKEENGTLKIGVAKIVPASVMGSGLGSPSSASGDYDITMHDKKIVEEYDLDTLRFGDIVAIENADTRFGRTYQTGACTIGVVVHSDCVLAGHGPGVTTILTALDNNVVPFIDPDANLKTYFC